MQSKSIVSCALLAALMALDANAVPVARISQYLMFQNHVDAHLRVINKSSQPTEEPEAEEPAEAEAEEPAETGAEEPVTRPPGLALPTPAEPVPTGCCRLYTGVDF